MEGKHRTILPLLGAVAGFTSAGLGIGGGVVMVPVLTQFLGVDIKKAIGTSPAAMWPFAAAGIVTHYFRQGSNIHWPAVLMVTMGAVAGAWFGALLARRLPRRTLTVIFAVLMLAVSLKYLQVLPIPERAIDVPRVWHPLLMVLGLVAGLAAAMLGIGGGVIMVPVFNLFFGFAMHAAVATSLTVILPTTVAGALFHHKMAGVDTGILRWLMPTAIPAAVIGALTADALPAVWLKFAFGAYLFLISAQMLLSRPAAPAGGDGKGDNP
ncbi:MAG: sulfite exporter TauE/SafE family protein [Planctomycetota bacterium]